MAVITSGTLLLKKNLIIINPASPNNPNQNPVQQNKTVDGKVTNANSEAIPGATIAVKGTSMGTITDMDGNYSISNIPDDAILIISFVGMKTQEVPVKGKNSINIVLLEEAIGIEEVVAIGYGTVKKT